MVITNPKSVSLAGIILLIGSLSVYGAGPGKTKDAVVSAFLAMESTPTVVHYLNDREVNNTGGHLQGIQLIDRASGRYAIMTGSSDSYSYYAVVQLGDKNAVLSVNKLMDNPFRHAGGFQVCQNYLAVGIEDNSKKDRSRVCILDLADPQQPTTEPLVVIQRSGEPLRSTAGCVGITHYGKKTMLAVGDWDTKHIDLYTAPGSLSTQSFEKIFTFDLGQADRKSWIDPNWWPYQNINLFTVHNSEIYLVGLGQNNKNEDVADLYSLEEVNPGTFTLEKIASKIFRCREGVSFKAGAGISLDSSGTFRIIACGYNIRGSSSLNLFAPPGQ